MKKLLVIAVIAGLAWAGYRWTQQNPEPRGLENIRARDQQIQMPNPLGK